MYEDGDFDLLIRGGMCVTDTTIAPGDVGIRDGKIAAVGQLPSARADVEIDAKGLHVLPGVIDSQVHFREPGLEHKEDLGTGTASAALGGITAICEMPNTKPSTTTPAAMANKVRLGREKAWTDFAFFMGAAAENADKLGEIETVEGCCGVKIFMGSSTGNLLVHEDSVLESALRSGSRRVAIHAEDELRLRERKHLVEHEDASVTLHPVWRDDLTALRATQRILALARRTGRQIHVLHITTAEEMALLAQYTDVATVEVTPQHLTLHAPDCYERLGSFAQMNPPIREKHHQDALWEAVRSGVVTVIGSDHAPHTREEKARPYPKSPSGMPGVQTMLPLMLNHVNQGRLDLPRLVELMCHAPARIYGMKGKGWLAPGFDGDISLVDMKAQKTITHDQMASRCGWTPFDGMKVSGWPTATIIRGRIVMRDGELIGKPSGQPLRFEAQDSART
jgi:dihydroorotase